MSQMLELLKSIAEQKADWLIVHDDIRRIEKLEQRQQSQDIFPHCRHRHLLDAARLSTYLAPARTSKAYGCRPRAIRNRRMGHRAPLGTA